MALSAASFRSCSRLSRWFTTSSALLRPIRIGENLPDVNVYEDKPSNVVNIRELFRGRKGLLFTVPGAFTPGCTKSHLPDCLANLDKFHDEGYTVIACLSVNDPFVMAAWGDHVKATGKVRMLADMKCEFTEAVGMSLDAEQLLGNKRSKRYMMLVDDARVTHLSLGPEQSGLSCLLCIKQAHNADKARVNS